MDTSAFDALADENRLGIVRLLSARGELCLCDIATSLGISDALASHHVKRLREAGLVSAVRRGTWLHCRLEPGRVRELALDLSALADAAALAAPNGCCASVRPEVAEEALS
jgi:ArsR family transcriptional regulator